MRLTSPTVTRPVLKPQKYPLAQSTRFASNALTTSDVATFSKALAPSHHAQPLSFGGEYGVGTTKETLIEYYKDPAYKADTKTQHQILADLKTYFSIAITQPTLSSHLGDLVLKKVLLRKEGGKLYLNPNPPVPEQAQASSVSKPQVSGEASDLFLNSQTAPSHHSSKSYATRTTHAGKGEIPSKERELSQSTLSMRGIEETDRIKITPNPSDPTKGIDQYGRTWHYIEIKDPVFKQTHLVKDWVPTFSL